LGDIKTLPAQIETAKNAATALLYRPHDGARDLVPKRISLQLVT
jgi:hypothetical protein